MINTASIVITPELHAKKGKLAVVSTEAKQ
jgi:hypothetical protein